MAAGRVDRIVAGVLGRSHLLTGAFAHRFVDIAAIGPWQVSSKRPIRELAWSATGRGQKSGG